MVKGICIGNIAIDCKDAARLRNFYAELLSWDACSMYNCPALICLTPRVTRFAYAQNKHN